MASVQFYGKQAILNAYTDRGISVWALFSGRNLLTEGDDLASLDGFLSRLEGNTVAEYKLCFYRDLENSEQVEAGVPFTSCYNVTLRDPSGAVGSASIVSKAASLDPVTQQVNAYIAGKVSKLIQDDLQGEKEEKGETFTEALIGLLQQPEKLAGLINVGKMLLGRPVMAMPAIVAGPNLPKRAGGLSTATAVPPAATSGVPLTETELAAKYDRIGAAIERLEKCDPDFVSRLEKLATLAETNPGMYQMAIKILG